MTIEKKLDGTSLTITLEGRLDTNTAPLLEGELKQSLNGITELTFDFGGLAYISCRAKSYEQAGQYAAEKRKRRYK